ncbi:MAG: hypothetical protein ABJF89_06515 [Parasphingorhabdus sp.]|uniref:hypothetical protein n=2 Tax=Parasphingorhabdus sp. TaxID=2709688 RepID=UPI0032665F1B
MILNMFWAYIYYTFLIICCGYAIFRGGRIEFYGAAMMTVGSLSTLAAARLFGMSWPGGQVGIFVIEIAILFALIHLVLKSDRFWPMWATAFHLLTICVHFAMTIAPQTTPWAFAAGSAFWAFPMLLALAIGSCEHVESPPGRELDSG